MTASSVAGTSRLATVTLDTPGTRHQPNLDIATQRQTDVLAAYVAAGGSVQDVADLVGIWPSTGSVISRT